MSAIGALFEVRDGLLALSEALDAVGGEIPDAEAEAMIDTEFARLMADESEALDEVYGYIRTLQAEAELCWDGEKRFATHTAGWLPGGALTFDPPPVTCAMKPAITHLTVENHTSHFSQPGTAPDRRHS